MIQMVDSKPGEGMTLRTVSFQGGQLSRCQRERLEQYRRTQATVDTSVLQQQVAETFAALEQRKDQGTKPERHWFLEFEAKGTPCVAELFGF
ncbi:hypothetical protein [Stutzerimonas kunmingensis]|uniref:hypothetical protein n=1 Tax=Stutzerimonas kunmingensis TaxID=1211807 RepID=UPI001FE58184|nr:hypothetical protein [Stutzerimonas kunmingensis]